MKLTFLFALLLLLIFLILMSTTYLLKSCQYILSTFYVPVDVDSNSVNTHHWFGFRMCVFHIKKSYFQMILRVKSKPKMTALITKDYFDYF